MDPTQETTKKELADVVALLQKLDTSSGEGRETQAKLTEALRSVAERLGTPGERRVEPERTDTDRESRGGATGDTRALITSQLARPARTDEERRLHQLNDQLVIMKTFLGRPQEPFDIGGSRTYREAMDELPMLRKSVDTGSGSIGPWIPTLFSHTLHEQVRLELRVSNLFDRINMPHDPYAFPIEGVDATAYLAAEQGDADADLDVTKRVASSFKDSGSQPGVTVMTMTSKKVACRITSSAEADEESIIPLLPYLERKVRLAMAYQEEDADINGDVSGSHMDSDVTAANDGRKGWNGLRKNVPSGAKITNSASAVTKIALADLRTMRLKMGKYGLFTKDVKYITGAAGAIKMLSLEDPMSATNPSPVITIDKYGAQATILQGEIGRIDGIPIVVSPKIREDFNESGFKVASGTADRTIVLCVNSASFIKGDRRAFKLVTQYIPTTDQNMMVCFRRLAFNNWFPGETVVSELVNIKL